MEREQLLLAWPTPAVGQPDDAELDVAAFTLNTAFLRRVLIEETPVAVSARAHHFSGLQGGMFFIAIDLRPGWTAEAALQTVDKQLRLLRDFRVRRSWSLFASQSVLTEVLEGAQTTPAVRRNSIAMACSCTTPAIWPMRLPGSTRSFPLMCWMRSGGTCPMTIGW